MVCVPECITEVGDASYAVQSDVEIHACLQGEDSARDIDAIEVDAASAARVAGQFEGEIGAGVQRQAVGEGRDAGAVARGQGGARGDRNAARVGAGAADGLAAGEGVAADQRAGVEGATGNVDRAAVDRAARAKLEGAAGELDRGGTEGSI